MQQMINQWGGETEVNLAISRAKALNEQNSLLTEKLKKAEKELQNLHADKGISLLQNFKETSVGEDTDRPKKDLLEEISMKSNQIIDLQNQVETL